jgi:hypothetical protein
MARTKCSNNILSASNLTCNRIVSGLYRPLLRLDNIHRSLVHLVDDIANVVKVFPRNDVHNPFAESWSSDLVEGGEEVETGRHHSRGNGTVYTISRSVRMGGRMKYLLVHLRSYGIRMFGRVFGQWVERVSQPTLTDEL